MTTQISRLPLVFSMMITSVTISVTISVTGCSKPQEKSAADTSTASARQAASPAPARVTAMSSSATADTQMTLGSQVVSQSSSPALANKQLVVTANAKFEVEDVVQSVNQIEQFTVQNGGYIANSTITNTEKGRNAYSIGNQQQKILIRYVRQATMLVRIPKNHVADFLTQLQGQVKFLTNSQFSAKDVTLDIKKAQLEAQIQASKQSALDKQKLDNKNDKTQAGNVEIINATALASQEKAYAELQKDEVLDQVNLSTIELNFSQPEKLRNEIMPDIEAVIGTEKTQTFGSRLLDNLNLGWQYFIEFVLWLSKLWAFMIGLGLLLWLLRWWRKQRSTITPKRFKIRKKSISETKKIE